jgi:hypothetical protein
MHPLWRRLLVVLLTGCLGTLLLALAVPVLLGGRRSGIRTPASLPLAPATPTASMAAAIVDDASPVANEPAAVAGDLPPGDAAAAREPLVLLDEHFDTNDAGWPIQKNGTVWFGDNYHMHAVFPDRFVAVRAPLVSATRNLVTTGVFRKVGGPDGGGYGLIVGDRSPAPLDGESQVGHYYVFEIGDLGEFGVWRRDESVWIDLVPWSVSAAVRTGRTTNQLTVRATGDQFQFEVNGVIVVEVTDGVADGGHVGLFVGGDGNHVAVDRLVVWSAE